MAYGCCDIVDSDISAIGVGAYRGSGIGVGGDWRNSAGTAVNGPNDIIVVVVMNLKSDVCGWSGNSFVFPID